MHGVCTCSFALVCVFVYVCTVTIKCISIFGLSRQAGLKAIHVSDGEDRIQKATFIYVLYT